MEVGEAWEHSSREEHDVIKGRACSWFSRSWISSLSSQLGVSGTDSGCCRQLASSYPGLLAPAFVACSTNAGEGLVKLSHMVWRTWTCGRVAHSFCTAVKRLSASKKRRYVCLMSSAQSFYVRVCNR